MLTRWFSNLSACDTKIAGGKGASLGEMCQAGIPVPPGFVILAEACRKMGDELSEEILARFDELGAETVAVRSSATVEDGSSASWAGQLETYLHVERADLLNRVQACWASVQSVRAVLYREWQKLHEGSIPVAVVVQKMVRSEVSGVAFSVHPVTKDPHQLIIEAGFGLGEAVVSGSITPDSYVVDKRDGKILDLLVSRQERMVVRGGWTEVPLVMQETQKLSSNDIRKLSKLVVRIEQHYGFPCDIEWAFQKGEFFITQSRPITTLTSS